jgi:hypothetical protein
MQHILQQKIIMTLNCFMISSALANAAEVEDYPMIARINKYLKKR